VRPALHAPSFAFDPGSMAASVWSLDGARPSLTGPRAGASINAR
jgi:hypothetical protein